MHTSTVSRFLSDKGIDYLREYLNLPAEIVPATLKKSNRPLERGPARGPGGDRPRREVGCGAAGAWGPTMCMQRTESINCARIDDRRMWATWQCSL